MTALTQFPGPRFRLGGTWLFNPPDPRSLPTDLRGNHTHVTPTGDAPAIPTHWLLDIPGSDPHPLGDLLVGRHRLDRRFFDVDLVVIGHPDTPGPGSRLMGWWETPRLFDESRGLFNVSVWTLFYARLVLESGPLFPVDSGVDGWHLVAFYDRGGENALRWYRLANPFAEKLSDRVLTGDVERFRGLEPNTFLAQGDPPLLVADQETLTLEPWYP